MLTTCSRCNAELPIGSQSCKHCGQARSNKPIGFVANSTPVPKRPIQIAFLIAKAFLWTLAAFMEVIFLVAACHGDIAFSIMFSVVLAGLVGFNKQLKKSYKNVGLATTLIIFVGLIAYSQSPTGRASNTEFSRQNAQEEAKEQAQEAKRQEQAAKQQAQSRQEINKSSTDSNEQATGQTTSANDSTPSYQADYDAISVGDSQSSVVQIMGREPDWTYKATDGTEATVLCYKDSKAYNFNELRIAILGESVYRVSYFPADGPVSNSQKKN